MLYYICSHYGIIDFCYPLSPSCITSRFYSLCISLSISMTGDCSLIVSASHDKMLKSWRTTPWHPDAPEAPHVLAVTDVTALLTWVAPPSFNCELTAFHLQYRIGTKGPWVPEPPISIAPFLRNRLVTDLLSAAHYQFRLQAENRMGRSAWSASSILVSCQYFASTCFALTYFETWKYVIFYF